MVDEPTAGVKRVPRRKPRAPEAAPDAAQAAPPEPAAEPAPSDISPAAKPKRGRRPRSAPDDTPPPPPDPVPTSTGLVPGAPALLDWYDHHRRRLPWRAGPGETPDPYRVWLSEIMLQQTGVKVVAPYFEAFTARWPTVEAMASAELDDVLKAWAGLGYYSRARNLHACARKVAALGAFPDTEAGLRRLPGVGAYTAAAIAAIAFGRRAAVVDGNVERVVSRLYRIDQPLPGSRPEIRRLVDGLTPEGRPGDFAQAMMDLGSGLCTPRRPACVLCPWLAPCSARAGGVQESYPRKKPRADRPTRRGAAFWAQRPDGYVLVRRRPDQGLLGGMSEIPSAPFTQDIPPEDALPHAPLKARWRRLPGEARHGFTHFDLVVTVFAADVAVSARAPEACRWVKLSSLDDEGLPTVMRRIVAVARD